MSQAETLFDYAATQGASRRSDPATSRDAGRSVSGPVLREQQGRVLAGLVSLGDATAWELTGWLNCGAVCPVKENVVSKRLTELRENGWARLTGETRPGSSHRLQQVHAVTDAGRAVA